MMTQLLLITLLLASASATTLVYKASCSGSNTVPSISTKATGSISITLVNSSYATSYFYATNINQMTVAHLHAGAVGKNGPIIVWAFNASYGPLSGSMKATFTFNPSVNNVSALLAAGLVYFNIHTVAHSTGEIRGQLVLQTGNISNPTPSLQPPPQTSDPYSPTSSHSSTTESDSPPPPPPTQSCPIGATSRMAGPICEGSPFTISCPKGLVVSSIYSAFYGRSDTSTCPYSGGSAYMRNVACSLSNILSTLESKAIGHESFTASNLPDPCSGTYKWFAASWCCSYPVPSSSPPPQAQATWVLSNVSQSCDSACGSVGKTCDIKSITSVIGSSNAFSLIASGGGRCTSNQGWSYDSGPGICTDPSCCGGSCIGACTNGGTSTVSCSLSSGSYKRLCACSGSVPPPPPPPSPWAPAYDVSKMVAISDPCSSMKFSSNLRTAGWIFCVQLVGSAIKPGTVTWADTGSWELNLPLSCVDMSKVTVLKANTTGPWGLPTHFVQGEVGMQGMDGTMYLAKGFKFYVTLNTPGIPCNAAMGQNQFSSIMGSFPSRNSLPFTLASAYAGTGPIGFGIVTLRQPSPLPVLPSKAWPLTRSYLSLVYDEQVAKDIIWSPPPSPPNPAGQDFDYDLQAIPGFSFSVSTPIGSFSTKNDIQWRATIDTGADGLRSRVDPSNPHRQLNSSYIIACSASDSGCNPAEVYLYNANVSVTFSGLTKSGQVRSTSYNFGATDPRTGWNTDAPNAVQLADWVDPGWPVTFNWPINRMNLGNTIYLQCPVVYWNYTSMRGGVAPCLPG